LEMDGLEWFDSYISFDWFDRWSLFISANTMRVSSSEVAQCNIHIVEIYILIRLRLPLGLAHGCGTSKTFLLTLIYRRNIYFLPTAKDNIPYTDTMRGASSEVS
jgi:hypothetical protein